MRIATTCCGAHGRAGRDWADRFRGRDYRKRKSDDRAERIAHGFRTDFTSKAGFVSRSNQNSPSCDFTSKRFSGLVEPNFSADRDADEFTHCVDANRGAKL